MEQINKAYQYKTQSSFWHWLDLNSTGTKEHLKAAHGQLPLNYQIYGEHHIKYQDIHIWSQCFFPKKKMEAQS